MGIIKFNYHETSFRIREALDYKTFLSAVMAQEQVAFTEIKYIFCNDDYLLQLNKYHLDHNTYTDILTFTLSLPGKPVIAEIYISVDRVRDNAETLDEPFKNELLRVMVHGLMHLCGYNDHTADEIKEMRAKEDLYLKQYFD